MGMYTYVGELAISKMALWQVVLSQACAERTGSGHRKGGRGKAAGSYHAIHISVSPCPERGRTGMLDMTTGQLSAHHTTQHSGKSIHSFSRVMFF